MNPDAKIRDLSIVTSKGAILFDNYEDTVIIPGSSTSMSFHSRVPGIPDLKSLQTLTCSVPGVYRWVRSTGEK